MSLKYILFNIGFYLAINTKVMSSNPAHGKVYSIQEYVIKFVSDSVVFS